MADAINNNSGLGFSGYEKDGSPKWDLISNINVIGFEVSEIHLKISFWRFFAPLNNGRLIAPVILIKNGI